jgi:hypothetical protein
VPHAVAETVITSPAEAAAFGAAELAAHPDSRPIAKKVAADLAAGDRIACRHARRQVSRGDSPPRLPTAALSQLAKIGSGILSDQ